MRDTLPASAIHILFVEDHAQLRDLQLEILSSQGFQVTAAASGDQAAALLEQGLQPDVLLSDIRMPGRLDGVALARWVRERYPEMVILLQTAFADADIGGFRVMLKPFDPDTILALLRQMIADRRRDLDRPESPDT
jgi:DNA-binding NtrC family response regulator